MTFYTLVLIIFSAMISQYEDMQPVFIREFPRDRFILSKGDNGYLIISRPTEASKILSLNFYDGRRQLTDVLTPTELERLDAGCIIEVWGDEIRVVVFEKLWEKSLPAEATRISNLMEALL